MIALGEKIPWGSDSGIMDAAADALVEMQLAVDLEKEYVNAYASFVDEMAVDVPFSIAFETLNEKLSNIIDNQNKNAD